MKTKHVTVTIEELAFKGYGVAHLDGNTYHIWNALPGETVEAQLFKRKRGTYVGEAVTITNPSKHRIDPADEAYISTSPWQIMDFAYENKIKLELANNLCQKAALGFTFSEVISGTNRYNYRNKMEFGFYEDEGSYSLSFFKRARKGKIPVSKSSIASMAINRTAQHVVALINKSQVSGRPFKSLIVRSNDRGETIAGLFVTESVELADLPLPDGCKGIALYYSDPRSPASIVTDVISAETELKLTEQIQGSKLEYGLHSFFQVNIEVFNLALTEIIKYIETQEVIDFYSGVGSISIPLGELITAANLVDINEEAIEFANSNIKTNDLNNFSATCSAAESITGMIKPDVTLIVDPPRAGMHKYVLAKINEVKPPRIIYLSCNPETQMRDLTELQENYKVTEAKLFNFFPGTPHSESLVIADRI